MLLVKLKQATNAHKAIFMLLLCVMRSVEMDLTWETTNVMMGMYLMVMAVLHIVRLKKDTHVLEVVL